MLSKDVVLRAGGPAKMIEAEQKALGNFGLDRMHLSAILSHWLARFGGGQLGGCAMFIGGANEHHLLSAATQVTCI